MATYAKANEGAFGIAASHWAEWVLRGNQTSSNFFAGAGTGTASLPFLGSLSSNVSSLTAGEWTEVEITYTVGGSGLADGAWIKGTFKFYSDWALFQTSDSTGDNYVSAEYLAGPLVSGQTPATVQELAVRFDQKGHERPFQKAVIIDIVDGYMNPGDQIIVRLGDRRFGAKGTRTQTFVEDDFRMRWYIDPVGTSRFAAIKPDLVFDIHSGPINHLKAHSPRLVTPGTPFPIYVHARDLWGNVTTNQEGLSLKLTIFNDIDQEQSPVVAEGTMISSVGWTHAAFKSVVLKDEGDYTIEFILKSLKTNSEYSTREPISVSTSSLVPRILFADLHVHSNDTVGTNNTEYNFSYAQKIAGLDIVGYTANDFNITAAKWESTLSLIHTINQEGEFIVFPGTEWCGNSAAGGDHNVVFLDDPVTNPPEFPLDKRGNVARSFEWNEDGPAELQPGTWPLDELYATYAHSPETHLLIPHVGGRRCNLGWHHPRLERLLEIGSAWGQFEWLLRDAVKRGWKMGVCANSDEHRGRCGGGVPGTAVFGTKGGLTGVLSQSLDRVAVGKALRARNTFATTGERLVGLLSTTLKGSQARQGDEVVFEGETQSATLNYAFFGGRGFSSIQAYDASGCIFDRDLQHERAVLSNLAPSSWNTVRITWGGARLYDRYREAVWDGGIQCDRAEILEMQPFGGVSDVPEEAISQIGPQSVAFHTRTSGDFDGVDLSFEAASHPEKIVVAGKLGGYVKVGDALKGNPHKAQPKFELEASWDEALKPGGKKIYIKGGANLFVRAEVVPNVTLPKRVEGSLDLVLKRNASGRDVYFVGREWDGGKVITSPLFFVPS
ncbi:uncharacterized protein K444DRAFT_667616 [Hyaloscypha bicolor E]|uniref:DUF3604 domain-containing protein n=1 Tax=Hyaloscypha bicolor E TaxID=1095630 RepID=A0A2J6ST56_9HELO|nr:uncharacterized protein K444DRAFT_667616 [Hyaloscypha bicolor E]PMD53929.1 hypothetical protein K444DRAFT_667616 [Hyaloscypha bicolor E]